MIHVEDKSFTLPDGRVLAFADNGNTSSTILVLFLHGPFSIGDASHIPRALQSRNVHYLAPSLPGWGRSSAIPPTSTYATTLASDISLLIAHLHPTTHHRLRIYLCAHSFGTVPAQMLYGLPHSSFPLAKQLAALILLAPASPPHCHLSYSRSLSWSTYILTGPFAKRIPGYAYIATRLARLALYPYFTSDISAESFLCYHFLPRQVEVPTDPDPGPSQLLYTNNVNDNDRDHEADTPMPSWRLSDDQQTSPSYFERSLGRNAHRSVSQSWRGFTDIPTLYHSGWGHFDLNNIETTCPVLVVASENDDVVRKNMAVWIVTAYRNARIMNIPGGHLAAFFHLEDIWKDVFDWEVVNSHP
ncbi:hypothetical protein H0H93_008358 [Arthromyces matolae]|nr:hypothetical protein H0H93_008358 [Arthromyces matolae]